MLYGVAKQPSDTDEALAGAEQPTKAGLRGNPT